MGAMSGDVHLGGRLFNCINYDAITVANEAYIHKLMRETGLDVPLEFGEHETDVEYGLRLQARATDTLKLPELLAGFLIPAGQSETDWSEAMAAETAKHIRGLSTRADREEVWRLGYLVNVLFFREGLLSLKRSQSSLAEALEKTRPSQTSQSSPKSPPTGAASTSSANGRRSFVTWLKGIFRRPSA